MTITRPYFSIIITKSNNTEGTQRLLNSIKDQNFTGFEIIIADSEPQLQSNNEHKFPPELSVQFNPAGAATSETRARNLSASLAVGKYLLFLDSNNELPPGFLEHAYFILKQDKEDKALLWHPISYVDESVTPKQVYKKHWEATVDFDQAICIRLFQINMHWGIFMPTLAFIETGGLSETIKEHKNIDLFSKLISYGCIPSENKSNSVYYYLDKRSRARSEKISISNQIKEINYILESYSEFFNKDFMAKSMLHWKLERLILKENSNIAKDASAALSLS